MCRGLSIALPIFRKTAFPATTAAPLARLFDLRQRPGMAQRRVKVFFDGGCRPNPGPIEVAVVVRGEIHLFDGLDPGTNADAEWLALIRAVELSQALGLAEAELIGDARQIVDEANAILRGAWARPGHASAFLALATKAPPMRIRWIKRAQNLAGIALAARHPR